MILNKNINLMLFIALIVQLQACNTPPAKISPAHISSSIYEQKDCKNIERELMQLDSIISSQRNQLQSDANVDTGIVAGSILLLPLGLFALAATGNGDLKDQYAQNLGKQIALKSALISKECNL